MARDLDQCFGPADHRRQPRPASRVLQRILDPLTVALEGDHFLREPMCGPRGGLAIEEFERSQMRGAAASTRTRAISGTPPDGHRGAAQAQRRDDRVEAGVAVGQSLRITHVQFQRSAEFVGSQACELEHPRADIQGDKVHRVGVKLKVPPIASSRQRPLAAADVHCRPSSKSNLSATAMTRSYVAQCGRRFCGPAWSSPHLTACRRREGSLSAGCRGQALGLTCRRGRRLSCHWRVDRPSSAPARSGLPPVPCPTGSRQQRWSSRTAPGA